VEAILKHTVFPGTYRRHRNPYGGGLAGNAFRGKCQRKGHADLSQRLSVISNRLADVERRLGATPADIAAVDAAAAAEAAANGPIEPDKEASIS
jgi:hypothetical protein